MSNEISDRMKDLRLRAESIIKENNEINESISNKDLSDIIHELSVYQIELELQNEELRSTQKELELTRNNYIDLFNQAPNGYIILSDIGQIIQVNSTFADMIKIDASKLIRKSFIDYIADDDKAEFIGRFKAFFKSPENKSLEIRLARAHAEPIFVTISGRNISGQNLNNIESNHSLLLSITDISTRKQTEEKLLEQNQLLEQQYEEYMQLNEELRVTNYNLEITKQQAEESEVKYKAIFEANSDSITIFRIDETNGMPSNMLEMNDNTAKLTGYSKEEMLQMTALDFEVDPSIEIIQKRIVDLQAKGFTSFETNIKHKDGHLIDAEVKVIVFNYKGQTALMNIIRDITERKQAEEVIRISEERYRSLITNLNVGIVVHSGDTSIIMSNARAEELLGLSEDQMKGKVAIDPQWKFIYEDYSAIPINEYPIMRILNSKEPLNNMIGGVCRTSSDTAWVIVNGFPVLNSNGEISEIIISFIDITSRKQAEEKLKESEINYRRLFETLSEGVALNEIIYNNEGEMVDYRILEVNPAYYKTALYDGQVVNRTATDLYQMPAEFITAFWRVHKFHDEVQFTEMTSPVTGRFLLVATSPFVNDRFVTSFIDITDRKEAEEKLRQSEAIKNKMISNIGDVIVIIDKDGINRYKSPNIEQLFGWTPEDAIGKSTWENVHPEDVELAQNFVGNLSKEHNATGSIELRYKRKDDTYVWIKITITNLLQDPEIQGFLGNYHDITKRKRTELELIEAKEKAEESDRLKTAFLQNMSHEIRTPLNGILGFSNLLQDENIEKDEIKEYTELIYKGGQRLLEIINNVLDLSKIETGQIQILNNTFALNSLMDNLHSFFMPFASAKNLKLNYSTVLKNDECDIILDEMRLNQILTNLINNAIKFTSKGSIDFGYEIVNKLSYKSHIQFFVKDTGYGIASESHSKIFERFVQVDQNSTREHEGAGLGLPICKGLVEILGGEIWLESEISKGTTFFFTIPFIHVPSVVHQKQEIAPEHKIQKVIRIVIAEDDNANYIYLSKLLKKTQFELIHFANGKQAVDFIRDNSEVDLVLMDIRMPKMDGIEATLQIKAIRPDLPVIAQTAYAFQEERKKILSYGFNDYISKPFSSKDILDLIYKFIN